ncbi:NTF2-like N-terminal transpeptidase domain-containing protein [Chloroflexota bacterium]
MHSIRMRRAATYVEWTADLSSLIPGARGIPCRQQSERIEMRHHSPQKLLLPLLTVLCLVVTSCGTSVEAPGETLSPTTAETPTTPTPSPLPPTSTPEPPLADETALAFLQAWEEGDYLALYDLLSPASWDRYPEDQFVSLYQEVATEATIQSVTPRILAAFQPDTRAQVTFDVTRQPSWVS